MSTKSARTLTPSETDMRVILEEVFSPSAFRIMGVIEKGDKRAPSLFQNVDPW